ncbi:MAG: hypothetical protein ACKVIR_06435, partial [Candidatus Poseidoniales archaeon]
EWNDTDGDGGGDNSDAFPNDGTESFDSDNDSIGDNADQCKFLPGTATEGNSAGCPDSDGDGWADKDDFFDYDSSQWNDTDFDGFGDNPNGNDSDDCITIPGTSYRDRSGCLDSDRDGFSDNGDICPIVPGDSTVDRIGCLDSDGDGISDLNDPYRYDGFNVNSTDWDGDGVMDIRTWISGGITYWVNGTDELPNLKTQQLDSDNDGYGDNNSIGAEQPDWAPSDSSQWEDSDGDGFGDNRTGTNGDDCISESGTSTQDRLGCLDTDGDGWSDPDKTWTAFSHGADSHTSDSTQHVDSDNDGFGNNATGNNSDMCIYEYGTSTKRINFNTGANQTWYGCPDTDSDGYEDDTDPCKYNYGKSWADRFACPDSDEDGISDENDPLPNDPASDLLDWDGDGYQNESDAFPKNPTQWSDSDGDNWGDNQSQGATQIDLFPNDVNSWSDQDGDGYADQMGSNHDDCELQNGNSTNGEKGCIDRDGDGWSDSYDQFMNDENEWIDTDNDGYGDNSDDCPTTKGDSLIFRIGCEDSDRDGMPLPEDKCPNQPGSLSDGCPDSDDDGISDNIDVFPYDTTQYEDTDHDGLGDNISGNNSDPYPNDSDNDGYNNSIDQFELNPTQWMDSDSDGKGDNWAEPELNQTRGANWPGIYLSNATQSDAFPLDSGQWSDADADGWGDSAGKNTSDDCPSQPGNSTETMSGCPDMDGDGIPDILDPDADGDGIFNTWEYQMDPMTNPFDALDKPADNDGDGIPDIFDDDDDNDGFPDDVEEQRGSDSFDSNSDPLEEYGGGTFYVPGDGFSSQYDPDGIEISFGSFLNLLSSEFLLPLLIAPISIYLMLSKKRRYKRIKIEIEGAQDLIRLEKSETEIDELIGRNRLKIIDALLLRNILERQQDTFRGLTSTSNSITPDKIVKDLPEFDVATPAPVVEQSPPKSTGGIISDDGYEYLKWPEGSSTQWFRPAGTKAGWKKWQ